MKIKLSLLLAALVLLLLLVSRWHGMLTDSPHHEPPERIVRGRLELLPCELGKHGAIPGASVAAYCTAFEVPEDWDHPSGRHITLNVAIVKVHASQPTSDPVVFLDGGPGGAATEDFPLVAGAFDALLQRHDVILIDQRGTGGSNALSCGKPPEDDAPTDRAQALRDCVRLVETHADPRFYRTTDAVRDLEAVRQALNVRTLNLIGVSYGTRMAQQYAARYPDATRAIVLDSAVSNTLTLGSEHARNLEAVLKARFERCRVDTACGTRFGDPYESLVVLKRRLATAPVHVTVPDPVTFERHDRLLTGADLATIVRFYAYGPLTSALLPMTLHEAVGGNYGPLVGQEQLLVDDLGDRLTGGMELSVVCAEDVDLLTERLEDADTLLGNEFVRHAKEACSIWPHGGRPDGFHDALTRPIPVLLLAGEFDPVTPPRYAEDIARSLPRSRVLVAKGQGHAVMGVGCLPMLVDRFLKSPDPNALDARCLDTVGDAAPFLNYTGAAP